MAIAAKGPKISLAVLCGLGVTLLAAGVHFATLPRDIDFRYIIIGDLMAGLATIIVCLAIQLRQEEVHYRTAMERAAIIAELNHHIRNAVFPLCLAVQKSGNEDAIKTSNDAVDRINIALKDASADAISGRIDYRGAGPNGSQG
ncbi:MAG TPA: hypothetical protein VG897_16005 [Terriglobales bacterium]|nr:hypothetical protein [Terriglobales bacterium]